MSEVDEATQDPEQAPPPAAKHESSLEVRAEPADRPLNADGRERPGFLLEFPDNPELQRLVRAFEAGNYQAVRLDAPKLAELSDSAAVRGAARELRRRVNPDPLLKYLFWVAIALFAFVVWYSYQNHGR